MYFSAVALLLAILVQLPGKVFPLYFQENVYTPFWMQPAFILLSIFSHYFSCKAPEVQQHLLEILWYKICRLLWLSLNFFFCYFQLKSDDLINTKSTQCLSISHVQFTIFPVQWKWSVCTWGTFFLPSLPHIVVSWLHRSVLKYYI